MKGSELRFRSSLTEYSDTLAGAQKLKKTHPPNTPQKATYDVISVLCFKQPETPFFPYGVNFSCSKNGAICFAVSLVFLYVVKRNTCTHIFSDESTTDESSNWHAVFSMARSHQASQLKVTYILTVDLYCNFFRHPAKAPRLFEM
ncbi:hypothetical protein PMI31_05501 [Pseudomonas sp. GM55]|nr:hypothetical protein PMI31_05501 [Pseudomonas sp. GM55]